MLPNRPFTILVVCFVTTCSYNYEKVLVRVQCRVWHRVHDYAVLTASSHCRSLNQPLFPCLPDTTGYLQRSCGVQPQEIWSILAARGGSKQYQAGYPCIIVVCVSPAVWPAPQLVTAPPGDVEEWMYSEMGELRHWSTILLMRIKWCGNVKKINVVEIIIILRTRFKCVLCQRDKGHHVSGGVTSS